MLLNQFSPGDTGADVRDTLNATTRRVYDVRVYGLTGDSNGTTGNGTDNAVAINALIATVQAAGGGTIWFPRGTYRFATPRIRITGSDIVIDGAPGAHLYFDTADIRQFGRVLFDGYTSSGGVLTAGEISRVGIRNVRVSTRTGVYDDYAGADDPLGGDKWGAQACLVTMRGCRNFFVTACELFNAASWTVNVYDCHVGSVDRNYIHDAVADGIHVQAGSTDVSVVHNRIENVGDDAVAVGASNSEAVNRRIVIDGNTIVNTGGAVSIYGPSQAITIGTNPTDTTWLAGVKLVAANINGGASSPNYKSSTITDVTIAAPQLRNIGMRSAALYNRGHDVACGVLLDPFGGGTIDGVVIAAGTYRTVRNGYVLQKSGGTIDNIHLLRGSVHGALVAGGAGAAASGGGNSLTPDGSYSAVEEIDGGTSGPVIAFADDFNRANGALGSTSTGGKAWTVTDGSGAVAGNKATLSGAYVYAKVDAGASALDMTVVQNASQHTYYFINTNAAGQTGVVFTTAGQLYTRINNTVGVQVGFTAFTGAHTIRLVQTGDQVAAYIDGSSTPIASITLPGGFPVNTYAGFGGYDGSFSSSNTFDNISAVATA